MIQELLKYQEVDASLKAIEIEIGGSEERKKTVSAKKFLDTVNESVAKMEQRAEELGFVSQNLSGTHSALIESAKEFEQAITSSEDEGEIQYLQKKADELLQKMTKLENEINALIAEMNGILLNYSALKKKTFDAKNQYNEYGAKYKELKSAKQAEMQEIEKALAEIEKTIPPELMAIYKLKRNDKMFPILFKVNEKLCSHCRMELSMAELNKLKNGGIIECDNCRSLLYKEV